MTRRENRTVSMEERRRRVAELYCQGAPQVEIAEQLETSQPTVSRDLRHIRQEWRNSRIRNFDKLQADELLKVDELEREAWAAFRRSVGDKEKKTENTGGENPGTKTVTWRDAGDSRFLSVVEDCIRRRCAILGLDAPEKVAHTDRDGNDIQIYLPHNNRESITDRIAEGNGREN